VTDKLPEYEVHALKYATRDAKRTSHFVGGDPHDAPMPMDYFVWTIVGAGRTFIFDTGFTAEIAAQRKRTHMRCPIDSLSMLGIDPKRVTDVILSHLHYDHVGSFHKLPQARFFLQEREMQWAVSRHMKYPFFQRSFEVAEVMGIVKLNFEGRIEQVAGEYDLAPGITLHPTPGHTPGLQVMRVHTRRGWMVLASDATHYYENMRTNRPYSTAFHIGDMVDSYRTLERLAAGPRHIIPGHDPIVMQEYSAPEKAMEGIVIRLDAEPKELPQGTTR
jgi:glyoxylase-like metal-dependent hydrolase (beta-lactamase superfamily II)